MNPAEGLRLANCDVFCCISPIRLAKAAASRVGFETLRRTADVLDFLFGAPRATDVVRSKSLEIGPDCCTSTRTSTRHLDPHREMSKAPGRLRKTPRAGSDSKSYSESATVA